MEVLLAGNTGYVTETFIEESFPECSCTGKWDAEIKSKKEYIISSVHKRWERTERDFRNIWVWKNCLFFKLSDHAWKDDRRTGTTETDTSVMQKE